MPRLIDGFVGSKRVVSAYLGSEQVYSREPTLLQFTTTGSTFSPFVELHSGSATTVQWLDESSNVLATGLTPTINFGSAATRVVTMAVLDPEEVRIVNLGFNNDDDNGKDSLPALYNKAPESVIAVNGLQYLSGLIAFMAAHTPLSGHLDLSNCITLEYVECFNSDVESIDLTGCSSLIRLVVELTDLTELDLNPVAATLRDLRAAAQQGGALTLTPLVNPMVALWHFCTRSQTLTGLPSYDRLPVIEQLWVWNCNLTGSIKVDSSARIDSIRVTFSGSLRPELENNITSIDVSGNSWTGASQLWAFGMGTLADVNLSGTDTAWWPRSIRLQGNNLGRAEVDELLVAANSWNTSGGLLELATNLPPSVTTGTPAINALTSRGWTVTTETPEDVGAVYWQDTFDRANGPVGAPWQTPIGGGTANVSSNRLLVSGGTSYQRAWAMPAGISSSDYKVTVTFQGIPSSMPWFGILFRMDSAGNGAKALFNPGNTAARLSTASTTTGTSNAQNALPASWSQAGTHTMMVRLVGNAAQVYCDGVLCWSLTASNLAGNGLGVGICGELHNFPIDSIMVEPI